MNTTFEAGFSTYNMKREKIILSFLAALIGLIVAIGGFYLYQSTKVISREEIKPLTKDSPTPTPSSSFFLSVDRPRNEEVFDKKVITISGKTTPKAKILIYTATNEESATPAKDGSFSTTMSIDDGQNVIAITAISETGEEQTLQRVVTYSTETF